MELIELSGKFQRWWLRHTRRLTIQWNQPDSFLRYVFFLAFMGVMFFAYALVTNLFTIPLSGDYVLQQIPFYLNGYDDWWHFFRTGEFVLWDSSTYLGANHIGSNSFYYYLNPFFLPILLFPRALVPQGMAILMIGKMVLASLTFRIYLKYQGVSETNSRLFSMAYGFSGWMVYYLWFNHFMEVAVVFPLVLLGIETLLKEKKIILLASSLFLMGITNYFFLVSTSFTAFFYAVFRYFQTLPRRSWQDSLKIIGLGFVGFLSGLLMSGFVFLPSVLVAITSDRVGGAWYLDRLIATWTAEDWDQLWRLLTVWQNSSLTEEPYNKFYPLISFLFPTVSNRSSTLFRTSSYDNTISSLFMYTPLTMLVVPSLLHSIKQKKFSHFIALGILLFMLFTPITYQVVHGFTIDYGRWQIFVVTIAIAYVALQFEHRSAFKVWYFDISFAVVFGLAFYALAVAQANENQYFFTALEEREWVAIGTLLYMIGVYLYFRKQYMSKTLTEIMKNAIFFESIIMGALIMNIHGLVSYPNRIDNGLTLIRDQRDVITSINREDDDLFRIFNLNSGESTNLGMRLGYNGVTAFHSLYNFHVSDFNAWSHMNYNYRGWSMGYHEKRYNLDTFLGIKYYVMQNVYDSYTRSAEPNLETGYYDYLYQNVPHGFTKNYALSTELNSVYENQNFIEGGFSFDTLIRTNKIEGASIYDFFANTTTEVLTNEEAYLTGGILDNEDVLSVLEQAPHLQAQDIPNRQIARVFANVEFVTCPTIFNPNLLNDLEACETALIPPNSTLSNFQGEFKTIHLTPTTGNHFGEETSFFALQLRLSHFSTVYFFDENNEIIVRDAHSFLNTSFKFMRGYYPDRPVSRIVIVPKFSSGTMFYPVLYREAYADYLARLNLLKAYPLERFTHTKNTMEFETNYDQSRFIVLQTPYDPGWNVTYWNDQGQSFTTPVYRAQGGFIGFVSGEGFTRYRVHYWTPYLTEGLLLSLSGAVLLGGVTGAAWYIQRKKDDVNSGA